MEKFLRNILNLMLFDAEMSSKKPIIAVKEKLNPYPLGAHPDDPDVRRIPLALVQTTTPLPYDLEFDTDLSMIEAYLQWLGTCVVETMCLIAAYMDFKETGVVRKFSRRFMYSLTRNLFGYAESNGQGLQPSQAAKVATTVGFVIETPTSDPFGGMSHEQYVNFPVSAEMRKAANIPRSGGVAYPAHDFESIRRAIYENKLVAGMIVVGGIDPDGTFRPVNNNFQGLHEVTFKGSVKHNGVRNIKLRNSWSKQWGINGDGFIREDEFERVFMDALVITDIPNDLIERAKQMQYIFITAMKLGSKGDDVKQLQKRLVQYDLLKETPDGRYGPKTMAAVVMYQRLKGLDTDGKVGPKTRDALNTDSGIHGTKKSKLDLWCEAIKKKEGWGVPGSVIDGRAYPKGTPAYRNNNPGNMRKPWSRNVIGYDASNFCIFPDYATGYMELRRLLENACTGVSKVYSPYMTLYQFYAKYAPEDDGNDPVKYAEDVARDIGVPPTTIIRDLL